MEEEKIQKLRQMDRALEQQAGMIDPKRYIGDIVMKNQIELLEQQVRELKREKEQLEKENIRLQKALNKKGKRLQFMFYNCSSLQTLDVSNFNTSNVTDMTNML